MKRVLLVAVLCALMPLNAFANPWLYHESKDEMRGTSVYTAVLKSTNTIDLLSPYDGGSRLTIMLISQDAKKILGVALMLNNGRVACKSLDKCIVSAKFDDGPVKAFSVIPAGDAGNSFSVTDFQSFLSDLSESKSAFVEIHIYRQGAAQFKFSPEPLDFDSQKRK